MMRRRLVLSAFVVGVMALTISAVADPCKRPNPTHNDEIPPHGAVCNRAKGCLWHVYDELERVERGEYCAKFNRKCRGSEPCNQLVRYYEEVQVAKCEDPDGRLCGGVRKRFVRWYSEYVGKDCRGRPCTALARIPRVQQRI